MLQKSGIFTVRAGSAVPALEGAAGPGFADGCELDTPGEGDAEGRGGVLVPHAVVVITATVAQTLQA
jgi:hypothetical protein